jgi:hypothetical protein
MKRCHKTVALQRLRCSSSCDDVIFFSLVLRVVFWKCHALQRISHQRFSDPVGSDVGFYPPETRWCPAMLENLAVNFTKPAQQISDFQKLDMIPV